MIEPPVIHLSRSDGGANNTTLRNWPVSLKKMCSVFSKPRVDEKDGSYFVRGPVNTKKKRADRNISECNLVILDGDSSINVESNEISEGAPPPKFIHEALKKLGINHIIYTTHSHSKRKCRYRVLITPYRPLKNVDELKACVDWLIYQLHSENVWINPVKENCSWSQPWFFPRISKEEAPFIFLSNENGKPMPVKKCINWAKSKEASVPDVTPMPVMSVDTQEEQTSRISEYNAEYGNADGIVNFLVDRGYALDGKKSESGKETFRLLSPGSKSKAAGVSVFQDENGIWRVCSHHAKESDPLADTDESGKPLAHDAFDLFRILDHAGDLNTALSALRSQKPAINIFGGSHSENVEQGIKALAAVKPPQVFQRGPMLCRVAHFQQINEVQGCTIPAESTGIVQLTPPDLLIRLGSIAVWQRVKFYKGESIVEYIDPPQKIANGILALQGDWHGILPLKAITETPIFRNDGSIHDQVGYDTETGLYYDGGCPSLSVLARPNQKDAHGAARRLRKVFNQFPFVEKEIALSVVLAYIFTLILRGQISLAPLFAVSATIPGSGKGLLIEICNIIVRGQDAAIMPAVSGGGAEEEMRKRIIALLLQGVNSVNLDNWETPIGGEALNGLLTANEWSDRVLGKSEAVKLPNRVTWAATGNNLVVRGDMVRRTLLIQLAPQVERPELREFKISNLPQHVTTHRAELLSDAFTILRAYLQAGRPLEDQPALGRFEEWWKAVCAPIVWLGLPDPVQSQEQLRKDDPELSKLQRLLHAWHNLLKDKPVTVAELARRVKDFPGNKPKLVELHEALLECSSNQQGNINTKSLGWYLKRFTGRITSSLQLERVDSSSKVPEYRVVVAATSDK